MPGLSDMKSLPCRIASMPSGARSAGMAALTIMAMLGSSRIRRLSATRAACGNLAPNVAARSSSGAWKQTSSAPPRSRHST